jgi:hypothetical protein
MPLPTTITIDIQSFALVSCTVSAIAFGLGWKTGHEPKELVCRQYIGEMTLLRNQADKRNVQMSGELERATLECERREQSICDKRIETMKERIKALRCRICAAQESALDGGAQP